jgi:D-3-phosphoglycerate dehydrogenase
MVGQVSTCIANAGLNIEDLLNKSVGEFAYSIIDVNGEPSKELLGAIASIDGVLTLRNLGKPV